MLYKVECNEVTLRWLPILLLLFCLRATFAQNPPPPQSVTPPDSTLQLSPQAAYDQASRPLDIVRKPAENWSDVEQAALAVAVGQAKEACSARSPFQYTGEDLLAYARLCAFAQSWQSVQQAATGYLIAQSVATPAEKQAGFPNLSMAFDYEVQASLHLNNTANAFGTAQTMLRTVAYDDLASDAVNGTVRYVQLIHTDQALALLEQRQPLLLALLKAGPTGTTGPAMKSSTRPLLTIHDLYADAIALPAMQQFANRPDAAATSFAELEAALPPNLSPDDAILTAASRRQYLILGSPLPAFSASASLLDPASIPPDLQRKAAGASAFLLFPNWCAQCVAMNTLFASAADSLKQEGVKFYALLAQTNPRPPLSEQVAKLPSTATSDASKPHKRQMGAVAKAGMPHIEIQVGTQINVANQLVGTPTLVVPDQTLDIFVATDFPLLIVTDPHGIVRYIQTAPQNALVEGGLIYQVAQRVLQQWPASRPR